MRTITMTDKTLCTVTRELSFRDRINMAGRLERMGVDAILLPEMKRAKEETVMNRTIAAAAELCVKIVAGTKESEIAAAYASVKDAKDACLVIALPTSTVGMEYQYHKKSAAMLEMIENLVGYAVSLCKKVELVALDASRAEDGFIAEVAAAAKRAGASAVTLCDDAGVWMPEDAAAAVSAAKAVDLPIYICPSDALHMAAAVTAFAIRAGADGIVTSIDGEFGATLQSVADLLSQKSEELKVSSALSITEIHRDVEEALRDVEDTEQQADRSRVYLTHESTLSDVAAAVLLLGYELTDDDIGSVLAEVQRVTEHKDHVGRKDLEAIIATAAMQAPSTYHLDSYTCTTGSKLSAMVQITLTHGDEMSSGISTGDGPIDAAFMAIEQIVGHHYELDDFQIQAVTEGRGAIGSALVKLRYDGRLYSGSGISTDIIAASIRAYLNALNKIVYEEA